jgi:L-2,3-diaminopropanoate---citrate ligase
VNPAQILMPNRSARATAEQAAVRGLLNTFLRETGHHDPRSQEGDPLFQVELLASGRVLSGLLTHWSALGHHAYGDRFEISDPVSGPATRELGHEELVRVMVDEIASALGDDRAITQRRKERLTVQIANSVDRVSRYLNRHWPDRPTDPRALTRHAEQSLRLGHPMHPTPKSAEGFSDHDLVAYAPELGAEFTLHYFAVAPELVREDRVAPGEWVPALAREQAARALGPQRGDYPLIPIHPWQAGYLLTQPAVRELVDAGRLVPLGPLGATVYPTSSVRTVCDPEFPTAWKLPLHVRITNFLRTNPLEHAERAADASRLIATLRPGWAYDGFDVLIETGYRTVREPVLAEDFSVLFRENPFTDGGQAPQVLAALLEERPGGEPDLVGYLREAAGLTAQRASHSDRPVPAETTVEWLRRYLAVSLLPALDVWTAGGVSLEAHVQNCLLHLEGGWPVRFYVRDMEGVSVSRQRLAHRDLVSADSPVLVDDAEAWMRLKYYLVTNHLGHLIHVLGRYGALDEPHLWGVVAGVLAECADQEYLADLRRSPTLPAKANLTSRLAERGERPLYVFVPNPMCEVPR